MSPNRDSSPSWATQIFYSSISGKYYYTNSAKNLSLSDYSPTQFFPFTISTEAPVLVTWMMK